MKDEFAGGMRSLTPEESKELKKYYESLSDKVDFAPVVHAKWLPEENPIEWSDGKKHFECSHCGIYHAPKKCERYCPYCGAKMA